MWAIAFIATLGVFLLIAISAANDTPRPTHPHTTIVLHHPR